MIDWKSFGTYEMTVAADDKSMKGSTKVGCPPTVAPSPPPRPTTEARALYYRALTETAAPRVEEQGQAAAHDFRRTATPIQCKPGGRHLRIPSPTPRRESRATGARPSSSARSRPLRLSSSASVAAPNGPSVRPAVLLHPASRPVLRLSPASYAARPPLALTLRALGCLPAPPPAAATPLLRWPALVQAMIMWCYSHHARLTNQQSPPTPLSSVQLSSHPSPLPCCTAYDGGEFTVQFKADGYNHFNCAMYPAHSHYVRCQAGDFCSPPPSSCQMRFAVRFGVRPLLTAVRCIPMCVAGHHGHYSRDQLGQVRRVRHDRRESGRRCDHLPKCPPAH